MARRFLPAFELIAVAALAFTVGRLPVEAQGTPPRPVPDDVDGDGKADLVWRSTQTGDLAVWLMSGAAVREGSVIASGVPLTWQVANTCDLDGDGNADVVWRNTQTGDVAVWLLSGTNVKQSSIVSSGVPLAWQLAGVGDLDGDGKSDFVWRNQQSGDVATWLMNGPIVKESRLISAGVPLVWQIIAVGDVDGDGKADLIWSYLEDRGVVVLVNVAAWLMNGAIPHPSGGFVSIPLPWRVAGVADLNGDSKVDIIYRETQTGDLAARTSPTSGISLLSPGVPIVWQIAEVADVNGDGAADLIWRNTQTGDVAAWLMNGLTVTQTPIVAPSVPLTWQIQ